jgi:hypothetical protein
MALSFRCTNQFNISANSNIHKEIRFYCKRFAFSCVAPVGHPLFIPPCIGALVHLYSKPFFGY